MRRFSARPGSKSKRNRERLDGEEPAEPPGLLARIGAAHPEGHRDADGPVRVAEPCVRERAAQQMIRGGAVFTDSVRLDPSDVSEDRDRQARGLEIRAESPHTLAQRRAAAIAAKAASSRDQVASRGEQGSAVVQVEAPERIHPASLRDVELQLAGRAIERGSGEESPVQVRISTREEIEPL